jgi:hypothetical protein
MDASEPGGEDNEVVPWQPAVGRGPVRQEVARRMVLGTLGFLLLGPAAVLLAERGPAGLVITVVGTASFLVFAYALAERTTDGTAMRPLDLWGPQVSPELRWRATRDVWKPSWWRPVVEATGWRPESVWTALGLGLAFFLAAVLLTFVLLLT